MMMSAEKPKVKSKAQPFGSDVDLARAASEGDARARRHLVERLTNGVRNTVRFLAAGDEDADDHAQLALVEILASSGTYRGEGSLEFWADRIVIRTTLRHLKKRRRHRSVEDLAPSLMADQGTSPEEELTRQRMNKLIVRLLAALPPKYRVALSLRIVQGYSIAEIAELTATRPNTVRERLRVGRKKLRREMRHDPMVREWLRGAKP